MPAAATAVAPAPTQETKFSAAELPRQPKGLTSGERLRLVRQARNFTLREVALAARHIADRQQNEEFAVSPGRLSEIETKGVVPSIYRLYSLALIYKVDFREVLSWFGIPQLP